MDDKASDLDIFDGLAAKKSRPATGVSIPPPPGSRGPGVPPPPSMTRQKTLLGMATGMPSLGAPPRAPGAPPLPPPVGAPLPSFPPPPDLPEEETTEDGLPPSANPFDPLALGAPPPPPNPFEDESATDLAPPPPPPRGKGGSGVDIDWDDEDEATTVFDRGSESDLAQALLNPVPPPPHGGSGLARLPAPLPAPLPSSLLPASVPTSRLPTLNTRTLPPPSLPRAPGRIASPLPAPGLPATPPVSTEPAISKRLPLLIGGVAAVAAGIALVIALLPGRGSLVVTVAGPGNKPITDLEIFVDNEKRCERSPCQVKDLQAGTHLVRVRAAGYQQTTDQAIKVPSGDEAVENITLTSGGGSGLTVRAEGRGLKLIVDGKEIGPLPQELPDLPPGEHTVRIDGGERYESFEKRVVVEATQLTLLEPKLAVKKGLATIKPGQNAADARVVLVSGSERRPVPQLPLSVDIPVDKSYRIVASKAGYQDFETKLEFNDGEAERTFVIDLVPQSAAAPAQAPAPAAYAPAAPRAAAPSPPRAAAPARAATGTLNLNSVPASNVILDGKPLGSTPKIGVNVPAGVHAVIFVHPKLGRRAKTVTVASGKAVPVVVKFE